LRVAIESRLIVSREGDAKLAGIIVAARAGSCDSNRRTFGKAFELMRQERRIGRDDDNNGALASLPAS
jgi:hypothetical protein